MHIHVLYVLHIHVHLIVHAIYFRFVDMFRKSRRHLRKSWSRSRSEDVSDPASSLPSPSSSSSSSSTSGRPTVPLLPPPPSLASPHPPAPPTNLSSMIGIMSSSGTGRNKITDYMFSRHAEGSKEKIREWIIQQVLVYSCTCIHVHVYMCMYKYM